MGSIICEICNGNSFVKEGDYFVCQSCGTKYLPEDAKKLVGTVKIDNTNYLNNLYNVARRAINAGDLKEAANCYEKILVEDSNSWEATFFYAYATASSCKIAQIDSAAQLFTNSLQSTLVLIKNNLDSNKQIEAVSNVITFSNALACNLSSSSYRFYRETDYSTKFLADFLTEMIRSVHIPFVCGNYIETVFSSNAAIRKMAAKSWQNGIDLQTQANGWKFKNAFDSWKDMTTFKDMSFLDDIEQYKVKIKNIAPEIVENRNKQQSIVNLEKRKDDLLKQMEKVAKEPDNLTVLLILIPSCIIVLFTSFIEMAYIDFPMMPIVFLLATIYFVWLYKTSKARAKKKDARINDLIADWNKIDGELDRLKGINGNAIKLTESVKTKFEIGNIKNYGFMSIGLCYLPFTGLLPGILGFQKANELIECGNEDETINKWKKICMIGAIISACITLGWMLLVVL